MTALVLGWVSLVFALLLFAYLIMHGQAAAAAAVLGAGVLGIIYAMISARLQSSSTSKKT